MLNYLQKFNDLPQELKDKVSSREIMGSISEIEERYNLSLATVIMRVMVRELSIADLSKYFVFEHAMDGARADALTEELKERVFYLVSDYLQFQRKIEKAADVSTPVSSEPADDNVHSSSFFFSSEDEEEVKELAKKLKNFSEADLIAESKPKEKEIAAPFTEQAEKKPEPKIEPKTLSPEEQAAVVVGNLNINFSSSDLQNRFKKLIETYIRGVRNRVDTKQTIIKSVDAGGLGLDAGVADKILTVIQNVKNGELGKGAMPSPGRIAVPEDAMVGGNNISGLTRVAMRDVDYDFSLLANKNKENAAKVDKVENIKTPETKAVESEEPYSDPVAKEVGSLIKEIDSVSAKKKVKKVKAKAEILPVDLKSEAIKDDIEIPVPTPKTIDVAAARQQIKNDDKVKMEDVKYVPKLMGPIDELADMNLVNFQRLAADPKDAVNKIEEKIKLLEEEAYSKRLEGIKAWRKSPLNKIYLEIGKEAINNTKGIDKVILERKERGEECMSIQEFTAVMDLNKRIRF